MRYAPGPRCAAPPSAPSGHAARGRCSSALAAPNPADPDQRTPCPRPHPRIATPFGRHTRAGPRRHPGGASLQWLSEVSWPRPDLAEFHLKLVAAAPAGLADPVSIVD